MPVFAKTPLPIEVVDERVRVAPRDELPPLGAHAFSDDVNAFRRDLLKTLKEQGFEARYYRHPGTPPLPGLLSQPKADTSLMLAYFKEDWAFREEPIVIDDGGRWVDGNPTLSIAVRDRIANVELAKIVGDTLLKHDIHPFNTLLADPETHQNTESGTVVFRVNRIKPPSQWGLGETAEQVRQVLKAIFGRGRERAVAPAPALGCSTSES